MMSKRIAMDSASRRQREITFVEAISTGFTPQQAVKRAGLCKNDPDGKDVGRAVATMLKSPFVQQELKILEERNRQEMAMSRDKVQAIVLEAIDMARLIADPMAIIRGAQELNKMCGYYAPEEKKITLTAGQRRMTAKYDEISDKDLMGMIEDQSDIIDAEFEEITDEDEFANVDSKFTDREDYDREEG